PPRAIPRCTHLVGTPSFEPETERVLRRGVRSAASRAAERTPHGGGPHGRRRAESTRQGEFRRGEPRQGEGPGEGRGRWVDRRLQPSGGREAGPGEGEGAGRPRRRPAAARPGDERPREHLSPALPRPRPPLAGERGGPETR